MNKSTAGSELCTEIRERLYENPIYERGAQS